MSIRERFAASPSVADLRLVVEVIAVVVATWLLLGCMFDRTITQSDGTVFVVPYTQSALRAGFDWTHDLYRFGVLGGAAMHDYAGTLPLVQVCSLLGLSTTMTVNAITVFGQACFGFFGIKAIAALLATWSGAPAKLSAPRRIIAIWACGFAPVIGWRLAVGHEALLFGLLPMVATISLLWTARSGTPSNAALVIAMVAVFHGMSGLGEQMLIYSVIFGAPLAIATLVGGPWQRPQWSVVLAVAAGALVALPRVAGMIHFAAGDDAGRGLGDSVTYSYGAASASDWLASIPWTRALFAGADAQERNFPIGPLLVFIALAWPRGQSRRVVWGLVAGAALAIVFADDLAPLSRLPLLGAFRVPARAIMPVLMFVPPLALACAWATPAAGDRRIPWLGLAVGALAIALGRGVFPMIREPIAWIACTGLAVIVRWRPTAIPRATFDAVLAVTLALGVIAFDERFPRDVPTDTIEHGPRRLREAVLAQAPELANPLHRVEILDPPLPFAMSTAFAAQLGSLDGDFNPPRRFLELLSALSGAPVPPTTVVFRLARSRAFPVLQQMYDVDYLVGSGSIEALPPPPGAAWFPAHVETIDDAAAMARALAGHDLHATLASTAWLLRRDPQLAAPSCEGARVRDVATDELGQTATIAIDVAADCTLIVATNYVSSLHATATVGGAARAVAVFPIDIALTGIAVPAGATTIVLAPQPYLPWWARAGSIAGVLALLAALILRRRSWRRELSRA